MGGVRTLFIVSTFHRLTNMHFAQGICASRQIFAFSRDGALPFSSLLRQINPHTQTPINAVWFAVCIALLLGLLSFAGPVAIGAIFSLGIAGLYLAYLIPIAARWLGSEEFKPGPFSLGIFVRIISCLMAGSNCTIVSSFS